MNHGHYIVLERRSSKPI